MNTISKYKIKRLVQYLAASLFALFIVLTLLFSTFVPSMFQGVETQATVIGTSIRVNGDNIKKITNIKYNADGHIIHGELTQASDAQIGQKITVRYDIENQSKVWIPISWGEFIIFIAISGIFVFTFLILFISESNNIIKINYLIKNGQSVYADFVQLSSNKQSRNLVCEWIDPATGTKYTFSKNISNKIKDIIIEHDIQSFEVLIEPKNPKRYMFTFRETEIYRH